MAQAVVHLEAAQAAAKGEAREVLQVAVRAVVQEEAPGVAPVEAVAHRALREQTLDLLLQPGQALGVARGAAPADLAQEDRVPARAREDPAPEAVREAALEVAQAAPAPVQKDLAQAMVREAALEVALEVIQAAPAPAQEDLAQEMVQEVVRVVAPVVARADLVQADLPPAEVLEVAREVAREVVPREQTLVPAHQPPAQRTLARGLAYDGGHEMTTRFEWGV